MHCIVPILKKRVSTCKSTRAPGAIFNLTEIAPRGRGYWLDSAKGIGYRGGAVIPASWGKGVRLRPRRCRRGGGL